MSYRPRSRRSAVGETPVPQSVLRTAGIQLGVLGVLGLAGFALFALTSSKT